MGGTRDWFGLSQAAELVQEGEYVLLSNERGAQE